MDARAALDADVGAVVLRTLSRDPELVYRALLAAGTLHGASLGAVRASIRRQPVVRALRALPLLGRGARAKAAPVFSSVLAGRYPRDHNYACRLFQLDVIYVPSVRRAGRVLVSAGPARRVLTAICVGSRRAFATLVERDGEAGVLRAFRRVYAEISAKFDERVAAERARDAAGYYTAHAHAARQAARREARRLAWERRLAPRARTPEATTAALDDLPLIYGGPGRVRFETGADGVRRALEDGEDLDAVSDRPFVRPLGPHNGGYSWLDDLAELTLRHGARREECGAPWHRGHAHLTFMTDAGDFGATRAAIDAERRAAGAERVRWCVVNKSQLHRKSLHIIERFHRTVRGALSLCFAAHGPVRGDAYAAPTRTLRTTIEEVIPASYNAVRHSTTRHPPDALWDARNYFTLCSAESPRFGPLDAFRIGTRVEVMHGKTGGELANRQVVRRYGGLTVVYLNHCTLELRSDLAEENVEIDHPVARTVWRFSPVPAWMCSIVPNGKQTLDVAVSSRNPTMAADARALVSDRHSVIIQRPLASSA